MQDNKLLQQIWRLVLNPVCGNGILVHHLNFVGYQCSAAKQLNRTLVRQAKLGASYRMKECKFCRIFRDELPSSRVLEDDLVCALLSLHPINPGHTLVIPRRHVCAFTDLNSQEVVQLSLVAQRVASALKAILPTCEGVSLSLADGVVAG